MTGTPYWVRLTSARVGAWGSFTQAAGMRIGPSDEDTPNLGAKEQQAARMVSASGVFAPSDAQQVVSEAVTELW